MKLQQHYKSESVATASPAHLVTMLYDRALQGLEVSALAMSRTPLDLELTNRELQVAQRILQELRVTLDHDRGGEVARNLGDIYAWCLGQLVAANTTKDPSLVDEVHSHISGLREAWVSAVDR